MIVVVDDDPDVLEQVSIVLTRAGCEVRTAGNQQEGEELLLSVQPDLAIFDLMMEQVDSGFVLCHYFKKLYPEAPAILLTSVTATTGLSFASTSAEAQSWVKADKILDKPVRPEQLLAEVGKLLKRNLSETTAGREHH